MAVGYNHSADQAKSGNADLLIAAAAELVRHGTGGRALAFIVAGVDLGLLAAAPRNLLAEPKPTDPLA